MVAECCQRRGCLPLKNVFRSGGGGKKKRRKFPCTDWGPLKRGESLKGGGGNTNLKRNPKGGFSLIALPSSGRKYDWKEGTEQAILTEQRVGRSVRVELKLQVTSKKGGSILVQ